MKKEHRTTPPADHAPSYLKTSPHSCDETAQKALEELGREKPAHEAEEEKGSQGGGKTCGKDGVAGSTIRRRSARRNTITAEQLRERYRDPENHSFPAYGNPKDGVPISDPMSAKSNRLKGLLSGSFAPKKTFDPGTGGQNKRPSYSTTTNNEPPRSAKRQKTKDEASSAAAYTSSTFAPPPSPSPARSIRSSSAVDLTKPDVDAASNRSTQQPVFQVEEYRNVQRNNSVPRKNTRTRKRSANKSPASKVQPLDIDGEEDEISQDMPAVKKRNVGKMVPFKMTPLKGSRDASEGISDSDLHKIDELASEAGSAKKRQVFDVDPISDDEKPSPTTSQSRLAKADMSRVEFKKQKPDAVIFKLKRAVSGKHILVVDDLPHEEQPHLQVLDDKKHLLACGRDGKRTDLFHWIEVKVNFCQRIAYATTATPLASISRSSSGEAAGLLVLEFAANNDALRFGNWVEGVAGGLRNLKVLCEPADSHQLQKVFDKQWKNAVEYKPASWTSKPDDIRYLESKKASKDGDIHNSTPRTSSRPNSAHQDVSYQSGKPLRSSMNTGDPASTPSKTPRTSSFFTLAGEKDANAEPRRTRDLPQRQTREAAARRTTEPKPSILAPRSPSPVLWTEENKEWKKIWDDDKPLLYPEFGKHKATVIRDDILRLDEGQFMNDNLIWFYMKYLQVKLEKENKQTHDRIYFMNTYFYPKLTEKSGRGINYEGVRSWTTKVDLFSYDYIVVPVNEQAHWYLAIICHPSKLIKAQEVQEVDKEPPQVAQKEALVSAVGEQVEHISLDDPATENKNTVVLVEPKASPVKSQLPRKSTGALPRKKDPSEARVITLDSLGVGHSATCGNLKEYLVREAKDKKNLEIEAPGQFGMTAKNIPEQLDHASCGAFLLGYLREFLKAPDDTVGRIVRKEEMNWDITSIAMRSELRSIIIEQREEQNRRFALLAAEKKAKRKTPKAPISSKSSEEPSGVPSTPRTPVSAGDAPKKPSSTIKGSPAIPSIPSMDGSSSPVKRETNGEAPPVHDTVPQEPSGSEVGIAKTPEELQPVASKISERPKTPPRSEPPAKVNSSPPQQRTSPRFNKGKTNGQVDKMQTADEAPAASPSATSKAGSAEKRLRKPGFSPAEEIMNQISSPSKTHPMPIRTERRASRPTEKSPTPTQQLLSESQDSPSKKTPVQNLTHTAERPSTHKDRSTPKQKDLQTLMQAPTLTSPYFAPPVKSPPSATKPRQLSIEEIPQPISTQPIPSIEDEGLYHKSPGNNGFKSSQTVTVDLTD
ncbi:Ubiquitin-like-specific protease 2 [Colletotrichum siamense]|uniref:Ubiquitin-like-specific protease 2 n=1 Tax=Colletotrichum siamense TaxID=690259 RepID=UPI0018722CB5|nr:Ubiquitin-like-specific protease 2 [Colletotrichum siamense]KAF5505663.1 Ubiquitin-like-specific protease 2 [Colletotrichum siamense]